VKIAGKPKVTVRSRRGYWAGDEIKK
jgi:hypothetical protein